MRIPTIKTPVSCTHSDENPDFSCIREADGAMICCDAVDYINATEAGLRKLCKFIRTHGPARVEDEMRGRGLWREQQ